MLQGESLDEIVKNARLVQRPEYDAIANEIIINRGIVGDKETERWLFVQMRLNVMLRKWRKDDNSSSV